MASSREELTLAPTRRAPAQARRAVRDFAAANVSAAAARTAELLASELVTNAVTHGRGEVRVRMELDGGGLEVSVSDHEPERPVITAAPPLSLGGRGLRLVDVLASAWGVTPAAKGEGEGKAVWFRLA